MDKRPIGNAIFLLKRGVKNVKSQLFLVLQIKCTSEHENHFFLLTEILYRSTS